MLDDEEIQELKAIIVGEIANLNTLSQVLDILVAGSVNIDQEGRVKITLTTRNRKDLEGEIRDRNEQLKRITTIFNKMGGNAPP